MSVYRKDYIVYGWKLPFVIEDSNGEIDFFSETLLPMVEGSPDEKFTIIRDGMCGEYTVFGVIISSSNDDGWKFVDLDIKEINDDDLISKYCDIFGCKPKILPKMFIFSHFL